MVIADGRTRLETPLLCYDHIPDAWSNLPRRLLNIGV